MRALVFGLPRGLSALNPPFLMRVAPSRMRDAPSDCADQTPFAVHQRPSTGSAASLETTKIGGSCCCWFLFCLPVRSPLSAEVQMHCRTVRVRCCNAIGRWCLCACLIVLLFACFNSLIGLLFWLLFACFNSVIGLLFWSLLCHPLPSVICRNLCIEEDRVCVCVCVWWWWRWWWVLLALLAFFTTHHSLG